PGEGLRLVLLRNRSNISSELHQLAVGKEPGEGLTRDPWERLCKEAAQREALMALAVAGSKEIGLFTREQLVNKIKDGAGDWRYTLANAGVPLREFWDQRLAKTHKAWEFSVAEPNLNLAAQLLKDGELVCRQLDGGAARFIPETPFDPVQATRRLRVHDL